MPSWPVLLVEVACGSAWAANYVARQDGRKEAKLLEARLIGLERSLGPFFRGVQACMRMVKCSQTLAFGLRLSVPMPPVARMEGRLSGTGSGNAPGQAKVALRELRSILVDVLEGGVQHANAFLSSKQCAETTGASSNAHGLSESEGQVSDSGRCQTRQLLAGIVGTEKQLTANLHRLVADCAARVDGATAGPEVWGTWWDSRLANVSEDVRDLTKYFEAATQRSANFLRWVESNYLIHVTA